MAQVERYQEFAVHFSNQVSMQMQVFAEDEVLIHSKYLFVRSHGSLQYGYCTSCKHEYLLNGRKLKHNEQTACKHCKYLLEVKASGRGRKCLIDSAYVTWYSKSLINKQAITATTFQVQRNYSGDYYNVTTEFMPIARYLFEPGRASMMRRDHYYTGIFYGRRIQYEDGWSFAKKPYSVMEKVYPYARCEQSIDSIRAAVKDTPFRFSTWEQHLNNKDMIKFFALFSKAPCVEYLTKFGMQNLVEEKMEGRQTWQSINWRGKTFEKVLGLSKSEIRQLQAYIKTGGKKPVKITHQMLAAYKWFRKQGVAVTFQQANEWSSLVTSEYYLQPFQRFVDRSSLDEAVRYMVKQLGKKGIHGATGFIGTWTDYIKECTELGMDLGDKKVLFPNDLYKEHQKFIRRVKIKQDAAINEKIAQRQPGLQKYRFEANGLFIRPAASSIELFDEGKALEHCVGGYAGSYADGKCNLFFIRRANDPDESFYTLEVSDQVVRQCRGLKNCKMTDEVRIFVDLFISKKLLVGKRKRIDVTGINIREANAI